MKTSVLKYYYFFILGISASIFGQNYSVSFGGQNGNIEFNDVAIESGDGITFSFWINDDWGHSNFSNGDAILDFGETSFCTPNSRYIIKKKNGEIQAWFEGAGFSGYGGGSSVSTNMLDYSNQFVHVAVTFNGSEGHIYVNGVLAASSSYSYGGQFLLAPYSPNGVPCSNGQPSDVKLMGGIGNYFFDGYIDDFSLWSYDLGTDGVNDIMTQGVPGNEDNLAGYWNFNQGSGTSVIDQTSNGNNGTISGDVSWSTDVPPILPVPGGNNSLSFDGEGDFLQSNNDIPLNGSAAKSLFARFKFAEEPVGIQYVAGWGWDGEGTQPTNKNFSIASVPPGIPDLYSENNNLMMWAVGYPNVTDIQFNYFLSPGEWCDALITHDGSELKTYINGQLTNTIEFTSNVNVTPLLIGKQIGNSTDRQWLNGNVDHVLVYDRALAASEVQEFYNTNVHPTNGLLLGYDFNETEGNVANDFSDSQNHGTIYGATWSGDVPVPPVFGCMDTYAGNYNPDATADDGSCSGYPDNGEYSLSFDGVDDYVELGDLT